MQVRQIAWIETLFPLTFHDPTDMWSLVISTSVLDELHLSLSLALEQMFNRITRVDCTQFGVIAQHLHGDLARHLVFDCHCAFL